MEANAPAGNFSAVDCYVDFSHFLSDQEQYGTLKVATLEEAAGQPRGSYRYFRSVIGSGSRPSPASIHEILSTSSHGGLWLRLRSARQARLRNHATSLKLRVQWPLFHDQASFFCPQFEYYMPVFLILLPTK